MLDKFLQFLKEIADIADTPGGHILIAIFLGIFGVAVVIAAEKYGLPETAKAASMLTGFLSIAAYAMRGQDKANGSKSKRDPSEHS